MARIRSIHPGLFTDEAFAPLSSDAQMLLIGIWTEADDQGVFEWKPLTLRMRLRPAKDGDVNALLDEIVASNSVKRFEVEGKSYGAVRNFRKWQRPEKPKHVHTLPQDLRGYVGIPEEEGNNLRKLIWEKAGGKCVYCSVEVTYYSKKSNSLEIDHVVPKSKGGSDDESNLACACRGCNRAKHDMSAEKFAQYRIAKASENNNSGGEKLRQTSETPKVHSEEGGRREEVGGKEVELSARETDTRETIHQPTDHQRTDGLETRMREAAGWLSHPAPNLFVTGPIEALLANGADLELDVLPVIRRDAPRCRSPNWKFFTAAIAQARDDRLAAANLKFEGKPNAQHHHKPNSIAGSFAIVDAAIASLGSGETFDGFTERQENAESIPRLLKISA